MTCSGLNQKRFILFQCFFFSFSLTYTNSVTDQYFAGETFDMIEQLSNGTYEIAIQRRYLAENFTKYPGQLSFHCHLLVLMTSWRMGINYKLFGDAGCIDLPPSINNGMFFFYYFGLDWIFF